MEATGLSTLEHQSRSQKSLTTQEDAEIPIGARVQRAGPSIGVTPLTFQNGKFKAFKKIENHIYIFDVFEC